MNTSGYRRALPHATLEDGIKKAGIVEIGLYPGVDHLYAIKMIDEVHEKGDTYVVRRSPACLY